MGRIDTNNYRYRARLALGEILGTLDVALFTIGAHDTECLAIMDHATISA